MHLKSPEQIDLLCHECLLRDNDDLTDLIISCGYLPAAPSDRALWLFCTARAHKDLLHDATAHFRQLLAEGYRGASPVVRARALSAARSDGTSLLLARALAGPAISQHAGDWSYDEWEMVITGFICGEQWNDLWLLVPLAPLPLALTASTALKKARWAPAGDDRILWEDLAKELPDRWTFPEPAGLPSAPAGKPAGQIVRLCFSPDGSLLATGCCDGMITVFRTTLSGSAFEFSAGPGSVRFLVLSADNLYLVYGGDDGTVHGSSMQDHARIWSWEGPASATALSLSDDNRSVFIGDETGRLYVLDIRDGRAMPPVTLHPSPVTCIAVVTGSTPVACGHADGTVTMADPPDAGGPQIISGTKNPVRSLSFCREGRELLVIYEKAPPVLWDVAGGTKTRVFSGYTGRTSCSAVSAGSSWFAIGSDDHSLRFWDISAPAPAVAIPFYSRHITSCSAAPNGSFLVAGFHDGLLRIYSMPNGDLVREFKGHKKAVTACLHSPDNDRLATVSWDGTAKLWRVPAGAILRTFDVHAGGITALAGPADTLIAIVTGNGIARVIDGSDGTLVRIIDLYTLSVRAAALSPDGTYLASTGADSLLRCWNVRDGSLAAAGDPLATSQRCCTFLPDGSALVTGGWDGICRFFRMPDATLFRTLSGHTSTVTCCTVSRDGSLLVTGSNDTTVRLWRIAEEEAYSVLRESRSEVGSVALSPDETLLATGNSEGVIRLYRLPYGTPDSVLPGLPGKVTALAFTADGCILVAGYDTGTCAIFSLPERILIRTLPAHSSAVTGLAILPGGRTLVSTGGDGICRFHALPCIPFLVHASLADIPAKTPDRDTRAGEPGNDPAAFLRALLAARFQGEIGICPQMDMAGCYDIQIVG